MKILVIGGAGYIGSVVCRDLVELNHEVVVFDNLSKGLEELVDSQAIFYYGDILNKEELEEVFLDYDFDAVMHFAALKDAGESMREPSKYLNNIKGTINILEVMDKFEVKKMVFSSSAAVYGDYSDRIISEDDEPNPMNFYGFTKLEIEKILEWYRKLKDFTYVSLRYFNVAGDGGLGYVDPEAKNIFPIIGEVISGKRQYLEVFGDDYDTRDGTCIRDYIHVVDLAEAHIKALEVIDSRIFNLGSGEGQSVMELINEFSRVSQKEIPYKIVEKREGDPKYLVASYKKAKEILGWEPKRGLKEMVESTLEVYNKNFYK